MQKIAILFGPEGPGYNAEGIVTEKFVRMLTNNGWKVYWIHHVTTLEDKWFDSEFRNAIGVRNKWLCKLINCFRNTSISKYIARIDSILWTRKAYKIAIGIQKKEHIEFIFSRIMPMYGHIPALKFTKKTGIKWIANWSDPMPRSKAPAPYGKGTNSKISRFMESYLQEVCNNAFAHTFPSEYLKDYYLRYLPAKKESCFILPHIVEKSFPIIEKKDPQSVLCFRHIGAGLEQRDPTLFLKALRKVLNEEEFKDLIIDMSFIGTLEGNIQQKVVENNLSSIIKIKNKVPYNEAIKNIQLSDIILLLEAPMEEGIFLPSKISDSVACGKPIFAVSPPKGVVKELLSKYSGGIYVNNLSQESIEKGLRLLFNDWKTNRLQMEKYSVDNLKKLFSEKYVYTCLIDILKT